MCADDTRPRTAKTRFVHTYYQYNFIVLISMILLFWFFRLVARHFFCEVARTRRSDRRRLYRSFRADRLFCTGVNGAQSRFVAINRFLVFEHHVLLFLFYTRFLNIRLSSIDTFSVFPKTLNPRIIYRTTALRHWIILNV